jgi:hypothetical protein
VKRRSEGGGLGADAGAVLLIPSAKMDEVSKRGEELRESGGEEDLGLGLGLFASRGEI